ncbi:cation channel sperm-associated auxiliary subunit gamma-like isoform X2 [Erythrolamprus reginae]|uniref:cation channel sperm-associated auxiliary subunit gamma-like isoform X2 n=1 Tax=Erythrolamprus reginae TaxID=121349 RepID=UPI00396C4140
MMWKFSLLNLFCLLLQLNLCLSLRQCRWSVALCESNDLTVESRSNIHQQEVRSVTEAFWDLTDSPVDPEDKDARYYGFPYFVKVSLFCSKWSPNRANRIGHYHGLRPVVRVFFETPVHSVRQKPGHLQIEMMSAPYRMNDSDCDSEEVCKMFWITPMPFMNGSVVHHMFVKSNGFGYPILDRSFYYNINGFMEPPDKFRIGEKLVLKNVLNLTDPSRPLWATYRKAPVLILGGIPKQKIIIISDTNFEKYDVIEVGIDSCWIDSTSCSQKIFSSSIEDAIATESTLFIRQNQLVYYFTGHYPLLSLKTKGSDLWTRILNNVCVRRLLPVFFPYNNTEYVIALGGGYGDGRFFLISCKDGIVKTSSSLTEKRKNVCYHIFRGLCYISWAVMTGENKFYLLVTSLYPRKTVIASYDREQQHFKKMFDVPVRIPEASTRGFVMLVGNEKYTRRGLLARGLTYNPISKSFYIWGNVILKSNDMMHYIYLSKFPSISPIKNFVHSFHGDFAVMTDREEVWVSNENWMEFKRVHPSYSQHRLNALRSLRGSTTSSASTRHSILSIYYDRSTLLELIYMKDARGTERFMKRVIPLSSLMTFDLLSLLSERKITFEGKDYIRFSHRCPFATLRVMSQFHFQQLTRIEHYWAMPPEVMKKSGFHDEKALTVYQGLVYQLLQLHALYHRPYADPVHDPTWRWWKDQKEMAEYFNYKASNRDSAGGIFVDMANYEKIYDLRAMNDLPRDLYLDKNTAYTFAAILSIRTTRESLGERSEENSLDYIWLAAYVAHPEYVEAILQRQELISRGSVLYQVTIRDSGNYPRQVLSGENFLQSSAGLKGKHMLGLHIGCPPGKRLAFDITYTKNYTTEKNKRYFDCVEIDPEMPCFYFSDVFYPFFLVQDMVTGESGRFNGSYTFTVIGGGAFSQSNIRYFTPDEIIKYNTISNSSALIWGRSDVELNETNEEGFPILSESNSGIVWICQKDSPCYDIIPESMTAPHYYFVIKVSNRGVDQSTYCDYALEFIVHIHGLRLSPTRALYIMKISMATVIGLVIMYIFVDTVGPWVKQFFSNTIKKMENAMAFRAASSLTFSSSFSSQGSLQHLPSDISAGEPSASVSTPTHTHSHSRRHSTPHPGAQ